MIYKPFKLLLRHLANHFYKLLPLFFHFDLLILLPFDKFCLDSISKKSYSKHIHSKN
nr:MAG TPA: hypothetical protein [Caudoviricetes sp.]